MEREKLGFMGRGLLVIGLFLGFSRFIFAAQDIVMETYRVTPGRQIMFKDKCALALGHMSLIRDKKYKIEDQTFYPQNAVTKKDYLEDTCSGIWEKEGFSWEANTKLYPKKVVHTISYKLTKDWEGEDAHLYINPWIDGNLVLGAKYKVTDTDGKVLEGILQGYPKKYVFIPHGHNLKEIELLLVEGGMIRYKIENKNPFQNPKKAPFAADCFHIDLIRIGEDGNPKNPSARLNLRQIPPRHIIPAGYSNEIRLEIGFYE